jgi:hypothetical protein
MLDVGSLSGCFFLFRFGGRVLFDDFSFHFFLSLGFLVAGDPDADFFENKLDNFREKLDDFVDRKAGGKNEEKN